MKSTFAFLALAMATGLAHAASSSAITGAPAFTLTDLDPNDGIRPSFAIGPADPSVFFDITDFRFLGAADPNNHQARGQAGVSVIRDSRNAIVGFGGSTSGPDSSYGNFIYTFEPNHGFFNVTPMTQVNLTIPYTLQWNAKGGGIAAAGVDVFGQFVAERGTIPGEGSLLNVRVPGIGNAQQGSQGGSLIGNFVSQVVMSFRNTTSQPGVFAYARGLIASGASTATGCMRSAFH